MRRLKKNKIKMSIILENHITIARKSVKNFSRKSIYFKNLIKSEKIQMKNPQDQTSGHQKRLTPEEKILSI